MPHIHTEPNQHDASVTAFIVRFDGSAPRMLLHMHRKLATLMPVGGHVELDETPWAAMVHELEEESGYTPEELDIMQPKVRMKKVSEIVIHPQPFLSNTHSQPNDHFHSDLDYLFIATNVPNASPREGESTDIRWLSKEEIAQLPETEIKPNIRDICFYIYDELLVSQQWERVPSRQFRTDKISHS